MSLGGSILEWTGFGLMPLLSLLIEGLRRKIIARFQNRIGPPIYQPLFDMIKLIKKGRSTSRAWENLLFPISPLLYFLASYALFLFLPFRILYFPFDFILFIYLFVLSSALYSISGIVSNSPFSILGSMRELVLMVCYEMILAISIITFFTHANVLSFAEFNHTLMVLRVPVASFCIFIVALIETRITPFDTVEAETEIVASIETEYSGPWLAILELTKYLRLTFFIFLIVKLLFGYTNWLMFSILSLSTLFLMSFIHSTTCRYRVDQTFNILLLFLLLAIFEFIRIRLFV